MGAVATGASLGMGAISLLNTNKNNKQKQEYLQQDKAQKVQARKNLLDQQLASRRAQISSMGLGASNSSAALQQRMAKEAYEDIQNDSQSYERQKRELEHQNRQNVMDSMMGFASKIIK